MKKRFIFNGVMVGILGGVASVIYRLTLEEVSNFRDMLFNKKSFFEVLAILSIMVMLGVIVDMLLKWQPLSSGSGIPQVQAENMGKVKMEPIKVILAKFFGGIAANLGGLSLGREGPSIQLGAACGKAWGKLFNADKEDTTYMISAGASAGLAAAFNAPLAGTLFTLEEMHKHFSPVLLVPSLIAAVVADFISKNIFGVQPIFSFHLNQPIPLNMYLLVILIGVISALGGVLFNRMLMFTLEAYDKVNVPDVIKHIFPFILSAFLGYYSLEILGVSVLGGGHSMIETIGKFPFSIFMLIVIFITKFLFTCLSYGSGAQGGIFLPVLVLGGMMGCIYFSIIFKLGLTGNEYYVNFIILGMVGYLTAVVRSPILSIMLVTEMTGQFTHILSLSIVSITAYSVAELTHTEPIYESLLERLLKGMKHKKPKVAAAGAGGAAVNSAETVSGMAVNSGEATTATAENSAKASEPDKGAVENMETATVVNSQGTSVENVETTAVEESKAEIEPEKPDNPEK